MRYVGTFLVFVLGLVFLQGQVCNGSFGDPVFIENFGTFNGVNDYAPPLTSPASTTYNYRNVADLTDGDYTVSHNGNLGRPEWHNTQDATNDATGIRGNMLIVNASIAQDEFYRRTVSDLCDISNATYRFSAKVINLYQPGGVCGPQGIPVNVSFEVRDLSGNILATQSTGNIGASSTPNWLDFSLDFQLPNGQDDVVLILRNNGNGGCGNDLAIDDIAFQLCGEQMTITPSVDITSGEGCEVETVDLTANLGANTFINPEFVWQRSTTNGAVWQTLSCTGPNCQVTAPQDTEVFRFTVNEAGETNGRCFLSSDLLTVNFGEFTLPEACEVLQRFSESNTAEFDLSVMENHFASGLNPATLNFSYFTTEQMAMDNQGAITDPENFSSTSGQVWVRVQSTGSSCFAVQPISLEVKPIETFTQCDTDSDGVTTIDFTAIQGFINSNILEIGPVSPTLFMSRNEEGIVRLTDPAGAQQYDVVCASLQGVTDYNELAFNSNQEAFLLGRSGGEQILLQVDLTDCTWNLVVNLDDEPNIIAASMDTNDNLLIGDFSSAIRRSSPSDYSNFELWHDFGSGRPSGDFIELNGKIYVSWRVAGGNEILFEVTVDANKDYVSHVTLGNIEPNTFGMAGDLGRLYGVTPTDVYEISLNPFGTTQLFSNPDGGNGNRWFGAAGLREASAEWSLHTNEQEAIDNLNPINEDFTNTESGMQTYYIRYQSSCLDQAEIYPIRVEIPTRPDLSFEDLMVCPTSPIQVESNLAASDYEFEWLRNDEPIAGQNASSIEINQAGQYTLRLTHIASQCIYEYNFSAEEVVLDLERFSLVEGDLTLFPSNPNWQYVLNDGTVQASNTFVGVNAGVYTATAMFENCTGTDTQEIERIAMPSFKACGNTMADIQFSEIEMHIRDSYAVDVSNFSFSLFRDINDAVNQQNGIQQDFVADQSFYIYRLEDPNGNLYIQQVEIDIESDIAPETNLVDLNYCPGTSVVVSSGLDQDAFEFRWFRNNEEIANESATDLTIDEEGEYRLEVKRENGVCTYTYAFEVTSIQPQIERYELVQGVLEIFPNQTNLLYSVGAGFQNSNVFSLVNPGEYTAQIRNMDCDSEVVNTAFLDQFEFKSCGLDDTTVQWSELEDYIRERYPIDLSNFELTLHENLNAAIANTNGINTDFTIDSSEARAFRLADAVGNIIIQAIVLDFEQAAVFELNDTFYCNGDSDSFAILDSGLTATNYSYQWSLNGDLIDADSSSISVREAGIYTLTVTDTQTGCVSSQTATVKSSDVFIDQVRQDGNFVSVIASGENPLTYAINGGAYQSSNQFGPLEIGSYDYQVRNANGCESGIFTQTLFFIPNTITPNGDGINDAWNFAGLESLGEGLVRIYDRYGKLLFETSLSDATQWNATYLGRPLPSGTYWYIMDLKDLGEQRSGSITVRRRN